MKWAKGRSGSQNDKKVKVLRMEFSIVENLSGLQESIFNVSRGPQLHFRGKSKKLSNFIEFTDFPPFPLFGVPWAAVIISTVSLLLELVSATGDGLCSGLPCQRFCTRASILSRHALMPRASILK